MTAVVLLTAACGSNSAAPDARPPDANPPDAMVFVEGAHQLAPQVMSFGGSVIATPVVEPIFFTGDSAMQANIEQFFTDLSTPTSASVWAEMTSEYGVGALTVLPTIVSTDPPPTTDDDLRAWLASNTDGTHPGWPTPSPNTIYAVFFPSGAKITDASGSSCTAFGAYHYQSFDDTIIYAAMPRCPPAWTQTILDELTSSTMHELVETVTDPLPISSPAFNGLTADYEIMYFYPGSEVGDICVFNNPYVRDIGDTFMVQRFWSNASAAAGHDPCVPRPALPYVNASMQLNDDVVITSDATTYPTKGISIPIGTSKVVPVTMYSDAPTVDWAVNAQAISTTSSAADHDLTFSWDRKTGNNGDVLMLTITRVKAGPIGGTEVMLRTSSQVASTGAWFGFITN